MNETEVALKTNVTENKVRIVSPTLSRTRCKDLGLFDGANCNVVKAPLEDLSLKVLIGQGLEAGLVGLSDDLRHLQKRTHLQVGPWGSKAGTKSQLLHPLDQGALRPLGETEGWGLPGNPHLRWSGEAPSILKCPLLSLSRVVGRLSRILVHVCKIS